MNFEYSCPKCTVKLRIPDTAVGKRVRCPRCAELFKIDKKSDHAKTNGTSDGKPPPPTREARIFISHDHQDQKFVEKMIQPFFNDHGIRTWYDRQNIMGGTQWKDAIVEGLNSSDWFAVVLSPRSVQSEWVRREVEWAMDTKPGRVLPILMEPCDSSLLHSDLAGIQFEDFTHDVEAGQKRLLAFMVRKLNEERFDWQQSATHQKQTITELQADFAVIRNKHQELETRIKAAFTFDGNWSDVPSHGREAKFWPLSSRRVPIVALCNLKGGVGKTTMTANLGATLWGDPFRKRVLLIDLDYQGSLTGQCLDPRSIGRLTQHQQRFVQELFKPATPDPQLVLLAANAVDDERTTGHEGSIIAADENLAITEAAALSRWILPEASVLDVRYLLRHVLHSSVVQRHYDAVLLDCPPRLTAAAINAFLAADFLLIPTPLDRMCIEAVPRLLRWVRERQQRLMSNINILGVVISRTKKPLTEREKELLDQLKHDCKDAWGAAVKVFETLVPTFSEAALSYRFPAQHRDLRGLFGKLVQELNLSFQLPGSATATAR
jgi:cellulose biosynthesis protein BcsQ